MSKAPKIREYIANGRSEEAIDLLLQATSGNKRLNNQVLMLSSRYENWKKEEIHIGGAAKEEVNKIHRAILDIIDDADFEEGIEHNKTDTPLGFFDNINKRLLGTVFLFVIAAIAVLYFISQNQRSIDDFSITVYVHGPEGTDDLQDYGEVRLRLGAYRKTGKVLGADGDMIFEAIPAKYWEDSLSLEFTQKSYEVIQQNFHTPKESQRITFIVQPRPMKVRGSVIFENQNVEGAIVSIENGLTSDTTDASGNFQLEIPRAERSTLSVIITYQGKIRFSSIETLSNNDNKTWELKPE